MTARALASKFRRALRNETGATFTLEQMREMAGYGLLKILANEEVEELCASQTAPVSMATTGLQSDGTTNRRTGKSPITPQAKVPLSIEALTRAA